MNRDILKYPTLWETKNSNKPPVPSHLLTWIPHTGVTLPHLIFSFPGET